MDISPATAAVRTRKVRAAQVVEPKSSSKSKASAPAAPSKRERRTKAVVTPDKPAAPVPKRKILSKTRAAVAAPSHDMIATAAYFLAEHRQFAPGGELQDWLIAEQMLRSA